MRYVFTFILMYGFWVLLSGKFDTFHLALGFLSSLLVSFISSDLLFADTRVGGRIRELIRFIAFIPWILKEIFLAATHVALIALEPNMATLEPCLVRFRTRLRREISKVVFANAITLTPGTITIRISGDEFIVHALTRKTAGSLPGEMEERIGRIFGEF